MTQNNPLIHPLADSIDILPQKPDGSLLSERISLAEVPEHCTQWRTNPLDAVKIIAEIERLSTEAQNEIERDTRSTQEHIAILEAERNAMLESEDNFRRALDVQIAQLRRELDTRIAMRIKSHNAWVQPLLDLVIGTNDRPVTVDTLYRRVEKFSFLDQWSGNNPQFAVFFHNNPACRVDITIRKKSGRFVCAQSDPSLLVRFLRPCRGLEKDAYVRQLVKDVFIYTFIASLLGSIAGLALRCKTSSSAEINSCLFFGALAGSGVGVCRMIVKVWTRSYSHTTRLAGMVFTLMSAIGGIWGAIVASWTAASAEPAPRGPVTIAALGMSAWLFGSLISLVGRFMVTELTGKVEGKEMSGWLVTAISIFIGGLIGMIFDLAGFSTLLAGVLSVDSGYASAAIRGSEIFTMFSVIVSMCLGMVGWFDQEEKIRMLEARFSCKLPPQIRKQVRTLAKQFEQVLFVTEPGEWLEVVDGQAHIQHSGAPFNSEFLVIVQKGDNHWLVAAVNSQKTKP